MKVAGEFEAEAQAGESVEFATDEFATMVLSAAVAVPNDRRRSVKLYFEVEES